MNEKLYSKIDTDSHHRENVLKKNLDEISTFILSLNDCNPKSGYGEKEFEMFKNKISKISYLITFLNITISIGSYGSRPTSKAFNVTDFAFFSEPLRVGVVSGMAITFELIVRFLCKKNKD